MRVGLWVEIDAPALRMTDRSIKLSIKNDNLGPGRRFELLSADLQSATWPLCHPGLCTHQSRMRYLLFSAGMPSHISGAMDILAR